MAQDMMMPTAKPGAKDPFVERMEVESDRRLAKFLGVFAIIGGAVIGYAATVEVIVPVALYSTTKDDTSQVVMKLADVEKKEDAKKDKKKLAAPKPRKKAGGGGKPHGRGNPNAPVTQAALKLISSRSTSSSLTSYDLMNQKFAKDLDKVINNVSGLTSRLSCLRTTSVSISTTSSTVICF